MADPETLTLRSSEIGPGLVLRCERTIDRFQLTVARVDRNGIETVLLKSVEGTANDNFPPSPPLQQIHMQDIDGNPVLLAVGMAGRGHWSASVTLSDAEKDSASPATTLLFQHAANIRGETGWLGCTWSLAEELEWNLESRQADGGDVESKMSAPMADGSRLVVQARLPAGCMLKLEPGIGSALNLVAIPVSTSKPGHATCWDFAIQASAPPGPMGTVAQGCMTNCQAVPYSPGFSSRPQTKRQITGCFFRVFP